MVGKVGLYNGLEKEGGFISEESMRLCICMLGMTDPPGFEPHIPLSPARNVRLPGKTV